MAAAVLAAVNVKGQFAGWEVAVKASEGRAPLRSEAVSYTTRRDAESGDRAKALYCKEIKLTRSGNLYTGMVDLPFQWRGRQVFLRVEGLPQFSVRFNDNDVGRSHDSRVFSEFAVTDLVKEGGNSVSLVSEDGFGMQMESAAGATASTVRAVVMAQPMICIEDYQARGGAEKAGLLNVAVALHNATAGEESFSVGYDLYSPEGKLLHYDLREVMLKARGRDTVRFSTAVKDAAAWSAGNPKLFRGVIYIKYAGSNVEYVPYTVGFVSNTFGWSVLRSDGGITYKAARFNSEATPQATEERIVALRKSGINLLCVDYPQPYWFYDICDRVGIYVVDQANINAEADAGNPNIGGALSNDPRAVEFFTERVEAEQKRVAGHPCVVAWSLGGECGQGYNMYMAYRALKATGDTRPVLYRGAHGEWNSDLEFLFPK